LTLTVNGKPYDHDGDPTMPLLWFLRDSLRLTGTKFGCGVGASKVGKAVQDAWLAIGVPQCGYCQAGQIMSATALLQKTPKPSDADIDNAMSGNLCRCGTYTRIRSAIKVAAGMKGDA
jgi:isoquinoline 1-oxidoreductase alpha subunit